MLTQGVSLLALHAHTECVSACTACSHRVCLCLHCMLTQSVSLLALHAHTECVSACTACSHRVCFLFPPCLRCMNAQPMCPLCSFCTPQTNVTGLGLETGRSGCLSAAVSCCQLLWGVVIVELVVCVQWCKGWCRVQQWPLLELPSAPL